MIKNLRVDHRLLHGQVAFSWSSFLGADCILLASDSLLNDELRLTTVKIARPPGIKLFIVTDTIEGASILARQCNIKNINLGGTKSATNKKKLSRAVYATDDEVELLKELCKEGIKLNIQMIPSEPEINGQSVLNNL